MAPFVGDVGKLTESAIVSTVTVISPFPLGVSTLLDVSVARLLML